MGTHKCLACGTPITYQFAICTKCEHEYGRSPRDWPEWLRFLWNDVQSERRRNKRIVTNEIDVDFLQQEPKLSGTSGHKVASHRPTQ